MNEPMMLGKLLFVIAFVLGLSFLASTDPNNPLEQAGIPISLDDLTVQSLLSDVPRIAPVILPEIDPENRSLLTAGIPILEGVENWFRGVVEGLTGFAYAAANVVIFAVNIVISFFWFLGKFILTLTNILRFDLWPAFQIHPVLQMFGLILTIGIVMAVVMLIALILMKAIRSVPIPGVA